jgi:1-phosphofructokinase
MQTHAAGKGLNVAQVLKDLGHDVVVTGFLGEANRQIFDAHFAKEHFENQFVYIQVKLAKILKLRKLRVA